MISAGESVASRPIRVAVIGCGLIAQAMHLPNLRTLPEHFELVGICDLSPSQVARVGALYPWAHQYTDHRTMLERERPNAVLVLIDIPHGDVVVDACQAGAHVFVEKPFAVSLEEADEMIAAAAAARVQLMVGLMKRYDLGYRSGLRRIARAEAPWLVEVHCVNGPNDPFIHDAHHILRGAGDLPGDVLRVVGARREQRLNEAVGGLPPPLRQAYMRMLGLSTHNTAMLRGLIPHPRAVASTTIWLHGDAFVSTIECDPPTTALYYTGPSQSKVFDESLTAHQQGQTVKISFPSPFLPNAPTTVDCTSMEGDEIVSTRVIASFKGSFREELLHFHDCIVHDREPETSGRDTRHDHALLLAMLRASIQGRQELPAPAR